MGSQFFHKGPKHHNIGYQEAPLGLEGLLRYPSLGPDTYKV